MQNGVRSLCLSLIAAPLLVLAGAANTAAQGREQLCDPANENCRDILINYIRNERVGIDVAFWFMEDARYTNELRRAFDLGVPVRVLMDTDANGTYPLNAQRLDELRNHVRASDGARIPM